MFPVLMKFYSSDPPSNKQLIQELLGRFGSLASGPNEAYWLAHEIKSVILNDPTLAVEVYKRTFAHKETSEEKTSLGGSIVMPLISTRRQDFSSALYGLEMGFQTFLERAPVEAAIAAVESVNGEARPRTPHHRQGG